MNKRYIDFVPSDSAKKTKKSANNTGGTVAPRRVSSGHSAEQFVAHPEPRHEARNTARTAARPAVRTRSAARPEAQSVARPAVRNVARPAVRNDARPAVRNAARPVARNAARPTTEPEARVATRGAERGTTRGMSRKAYVPPVTERPARARRATKSEHVDFGVIEDLEPAEDRVKTERKPLTNKTMTIPRTPFINQNRVEKRPLSKNVYRQKPAPTPKKEEAVGPVTIIAKPEKEKHVGLIITIILTIILGAAAGTVAFLLLPK